MVLVAIEQGYPEAERIISDPLAHPILPLSSRFWVRVSLAMRSWLVAKTEQKAPGLWGGIMARKRYIDDVLCEAANGSLGAVVNLGAGFDTRAARLPELEAIPVWEVDQPGNIEAKRRRLRAVLGEVPDHVKLVSIDFDKEDLAEAWAARDVMQEMTEEEEGEEVDMGDEEFGQAEEDEPDLELGDDDEEESE